MADDQAHHLKVFRENGQYLGTLTADFEYPHCTYYDVHTRLLYIAGGTVGNDRVWVCKYDPASLLPPPTKKLSLKLELVAISR